MKKTLFAISLSLLASGFTLTSCSDYEDKYLPMPDVRTETYRPQVHYTPAKNWMNDPNGLVFLDGTYHLFYQYNPEGNVWGNMSWGHATSTDLMHWEEQPVAIKYINDKNFIFSGSCVIDKDNTAGFGKNAMIALYTLSSEGKQMECLAYSNDGGKTFVQYEGNPVIPNDDDNLRDPKVFWHEASKQWIMCLAKGWKTGIEIWGSKNLKEWEQLSIFNVNEPRLQNIQWECPDLICMDYEGGKKWVLIVSVNPGGPKQGSGTMYFTGDFDGTTFTADNRQYPIWMDYGMDNYAGVTFSNVQGRTVLIGWMNNWDYADAVPCDPWRSAMTLPRELSLVKKGGEPVLASVPVRELAGSAFDACQNGQVWPKGGAYELVIEDFDLSADQQIVLGNRYDNEFTIRFNKAENSFVALRNEKAGRSVFHDKFKQDIAAKLCQVEGKTTVRLIIDQSSLELFVADGTTCMTNLVFPFVIYDRCTTTTGNAKVRVLNRVW